MHTYIHTHTRAFIYLYCIPIIFKLSSHFISLNFEFYLIENNNYMAYYGRVLIYGNENIRVDISLGNIYTTQHKYTYICI